MILARGFRLGGEFAHNWSVVFISMGGQKGTGPVLVIWRGWSIGHWGSMVWFPLDATLGRPSTIR